MDPCYRLRRLEDLGTAQADCSLIVVPVVKWSTQRKAISPKLYHHFETVLEGRVLRVDFAVISDGVFASLSRRVLRSREILASRCSVSSSTICLTTRVVLSIDVSGWESYALNRLLLVSFVIFQIPL